MPPVALSRNGIPGLAVHMLDQYPRDGLGIYDDLEISSQFSGYVWSDWTTNRHDISGPCAADIHMYDVSAGQEATSKPPATRRMANDASETRFLTRQMHKRVPAWKLQMCI